MKRGLLNVALRTMLSYSLLLLPLEGRLQGQTLYEVVFICDSRFPIGLEAAVLMDAAVMRHNSRFSARSATKF